MFGAQQVRPMQVFITTMSPQAKNKQNKAIIGNLGEDLACEYLVEKGYNILRRNVRSRRGELDIVAKSSDQTLVFVEVKTMASPPDTTASAVLLVHDFKNHKIFSHNHIDKFFN